MENNNYSLKSWYEDRYFANDTISFNVIDNQNGKPIDCVNIPCRGNKFMVRGHWRTFQEAQEYAKQILNSWFE